MYQKHSKELLVQRGFQSSDYPHPVATTWTISFQKVEQANPAAELLRFCAFLAPDAIPEELISNGASQWSPEAHNNSSLPPRRGARETIQQAEKHPVSSA